jgi:hypothetical protein
MRENQEVSASDAFADMDRIFDQKLAIHDRDPPESPVPDEFAFLETISKKSQMLA